MTSAGELSARVRGGECSARELVEIALGEDPCRAFTWRDPRATLHAEAIDRAVARGEDPGPLAGVPIALKANLCVRDWPCDCGSQALSGWTAPYDATVASRLRAAGAILIGLCNMDEFGMGSSTERSIHGPTRNPTDPERVAGGSSGGSAAAVAAGLVPIALGSDTGGSVRQPAALCGVFGFKPSYGRISRRGLVAYASSLDHVGVLARSAKDLALATATIAGPDPLDPTLRPSPPPRSAPRLRTIEGLRIGVLAETLGEPTEPEVTARIEAGAERWAAAGARVERISLPSLSLALPAYYVIALAEASSNLGRFDGLRFGRGPAAHEAGPAAAMAAARSHLGEEVRRRILLGAHVLRAGYRDAWYERAARVRRRLVQELAQAFEEFELLLSPTAPSPAWKLGERLADPLEMYAGDLCTVPQNLAGLPSVSLPCGTARPRGGGPPLPVGLQLCAPPGHDEIVLAAARSWEELG